MQSTYDLTQQIEKIISDKGLPNGSCRAYINFYGGVKYAMIVEYYTIRDDYNTRVSQTFRGDFAEALEYATGLKSMETLNREAFLSRLAHLVEQAADLGIKLPNLSLALDEYKNNLLENHQ